MPAPFVSTAFCGTPPKHQAIQTTVEAAQHIAKHESPRTTRLYDRRQDEISLDEVEQIAIRNHVKARIKRGPHSFPQIIQEFRRSSHA
jgi:hypothetical protein